jgi:hypothetical protein
MAHENEAFIQVLGDGVGVEAVKSRPPMVSVYVVFGVVRVHAQKWHFASPHLASR